MLQPVVRGPGMNVGIPDPCATPPLGVPAPYPSLSLHVMLQLASIVVKMGGLAAANIGAFSPMSMGMEAGAMHPLLKMRTAFTLGCPIVLVDALPEAIQMALGISNMGNCPLALALVPAGVNVLVCQRAPDEAADAAGRARLLAAALEQPPLAWDEDGEVVRLRVRVFSDELPTELHRVLARVQERGARCLELDLRGCPGGELDAAVRVAAAFLPAGTLVARITDEDGDEQELRTPWAGDTETPLVVRVDGATASAAEVLAAALQDAGRARVVGERTFGKGTLEHLIAATGAAGGWLPAGTCARPAGASLGAGVSPDG